MKRISRKICINFGIECHQEVTRPKRVVEIEIAKEIGSRRLAIATVSDRIAQMVVKIYLEPKVESNFDIDSYGYRPRKSAIDAMLKTKERCWKYAWTIDLDIEKFFDALDRELLMKALKKHNEEKWIEMYIKRWLEGEILTTEGHLIRKEKGVAQGAVISPLLANLYLHYTFDVWMRRKYPTVTFERYADDIKIHCKTEKQAFFIGQAINDRLHKCGLKANNNKSKIVSCRHKCQYKYMTFDFLDYTFQPRKCRRKDGRFFVGFMPAVSKKACRKLLNRIRSLNIHRRSNLSLQDLANLVNPIIRGWINYFKHSYKSAMYSTLNTINLILIRWVRRTFKRSKSGIRRAKLWLLRIAEKERHLFAHWTFGALP